jgi:tricarballylate dehydrogenase
MAIGGEGRFDVIVAGAGNAALCAALAAREEGARVLVLEKAPYEERGGNSACSGGLFEFAHQGLEDVMPLVPELTPVEVEHLDMGPYTADTYYDNLIRLSDERADPELCRVLADQSYDTLRWMQGLGVHFELYQRAPRRGGRTIFLPGNELQTWGAGLGLMQQLFHIAEGRGVDIAYGTAVTGLVTDDRDGVSGVRVHSEDGAQSLEAGGVVLGSGGFEANPEMRARYLGPGWDFMKVRGTRHNTGELLDRAREIGAGSSGAWSASDCGSVDVAAAAFGSSKTGNVSARSSERLGIMVNTEGRRFVDEGAEFHHTGGVALGNAVWSQPGGIAYQLFDQQTVKMLDPERYHSGGPPVTADTVEELARSLGVDSDALSDTVAQYNRAVQEGTFDTIIKDGKGTRGLEPSKSNWALRLERPPFVAYRVTTSIVFTHGGIAVDGEARVLDIASQPIPGLYATGEAIGGIFYRRFSTGAGLMLGSVFGRIAGRNAAKQAR